MKNSGTLDFAMSIDASATELLSDAIVFEYLKSRGLAKTAEVYALESKRKYPNLASADELSSQLWLTFRQQVGYKNDGSKSGAPSTFEFLIKNTLEGLDSNEDGTSTKKDGRHSRSSSTASETPTIATQRSAATVPTRKKKKKKAKPKKYQSPALSRNVDVNHNVSFHRLGKPVFRRQSPKVNTDSDGFEPQKSREHWMPMELRLKMLKRDMMLAQQYQRDVNEWKTRKEKNSYKTDEHTRRKTLKELTKRGPVAKTTCALCEHGFLELPFGVSYKAIMDLRRTWGVKVTPSSKYYKFSLIPHCYETVHVCVFCSQFFGLEFFDSQRQKAVGV